MPLSPSEQMADLIVSVFISHYPCEADIINTNSGMSNSWHISFQTVFPTVSVDVKARSVLPFIAFWMML